MSEAVLNVHTNMNLEDCEDGGKLYTQTYLTHSNNCGWHTTHRWPVLTRAVVLYSYCAPYGIVECGAAGYLLQSIYVASSQTEYRINYVNKGACFVICLSVCIVPFAPHWPCPSPCNRVSKQMLYFCIFWSTCFIDNKPVVNLCLDTYSGASGCQKPYLSTNYSPTKALEEPKVEEADEIEETEADEDTSRNQCSWW